MGLTRLGYCSSWARGCVSSVRTAPAPGAAACTSPVCKAKSPLRIPFHIAELRKLARRGRS
eukprot:scaffold3854_cov107-Isochrysis_galbana.AAC.10